MATDLVSLEAAARELGTTPLRLLMLVKQGILAGEMVEGEWFVLRPAIERFTAAGGDRRADLACKASCGKSACSCS
ncbi:hypothetical protein GPICK_03825 [Geobacter pickeringii]|uniref:Helix-turn-helix domain-containing protein n=2 Tax=Geobacter pickeringii TaxID=345632 RepID=A0A0B5BE98_9BACT|nr:hypothetical protein GPICK_03825 [Geobacter pickeringii]